MIYSKLYKKYFPFHSCAEIQMLDEKEKELLISYVKRFACDVDVRNKIAFENAAKNGIKKVEIYELIKPESFYTELADKISESKVITDEELKSVNNILYRNKYNWFLSAYFFPVRDEEKNNDFIRTIYEEQRTSDGKYIIVYGVAIIALIVLLSQTQLDAIGKEILEKARNVFDYYVR